MKIEDALRKLEQERELIKSLEAAEFPRDYRKFESRVDELKRTPQGKRVLDRWRSYHLRCADKREEYKVISVCKDCPSTIFLPLLQSDLAKETSHRWDVLTKGLPSPKRELAAKEPVPAKAAALYAEAERDEDLALASLKKELNGSAAGERWLAAVSKPAVPIRPMDAKERRSFIDFVREMKPSQPIICVWSAPMTQADYVKATAMARKTIQRFLAEIKACPCPSGHNAAVAARYSVDVNLKVLAQWIGVWIKDPKTAAGLAAATLAYTDIHEEAFTPKILGALNPVLERRGLSEETVRQIKAHYGYYDPILPLKP